MADLLIAITGDVKDGRKYDPPSRVDAASAKQAAEELGAELAKQGAQLLVYGGPFLEADVVRGYVKANPKKDEVITMWYTEGDQPIPFPEEKTHPKLFKKTIQPGEDWEVAFYRSIARADGIILMGGNDTTKISGQVAIGSKMPILALSQFGGGAAKVRETLSAGEDLPIREEIDLMATPWGQDSAAKCVKALFAQYERKQIAAIGLDPTWTIVGGGLFVLALAILAGVFGKGKFEAWMLFIIPLLAGGAGALIKQQVLLHKPVNAATLILGLVAGGISGVLFITAQITANPDWGKLASVTENSTHSMPFAFVVGFVGGITSDALFLKLSKIDVGDKKGIS